MSLYLLPSGAHSHTHSHTHACTRSDRDLRCIHMPRHDHIPLTFGPNDSLLHVRLYTKWRLQTPAPTPACESLSTLRTAELGRGPARSALLLADVSWLLTAASLSGDGVTCTFSLFLCPLSPFFRKSRILLGQSLPLFFSILLPRCWDSE